MKKNIFFVFFVFFIILSIPVTVEASSMRMRVNGVIWDVPQVMVDNSKRFMMFSTKKKPKIKISGVIEEHFIRQNPRTS